MAENLTKRLVDLSSLGLAPQGNAELRFDHRKGGFDVRALVIALHEEFRVVAVQVEQDFWSREGHMRQGPVIFSDLVIGFTPRGVIPGMQEFLHHLVPSAYYWRGAGFVGKLSRRFLYRLMWGNAAAGFTTLRRVAFL